MWSVSISPEIYGDLARMRRGAKQDHTKCFELILDLLIDPRSGIGKPEQLKYQSQREVWSRRINEKDRLIYTIFEETQKILVQSVLGHYDDH
jgi:toxin YoeB